MARVALPLLITLFAACSADEDPGALVLGDEDELAAAGERSRSSDGYDGYDEDRDRRDDAPFLPGESQPKVDTRVLPLAIHPELAGQNLAQTFTPSADQFLGYLELPVACAAGVLLNVKIREGVGGTVLYEGNNTGLPTVADGSMVLIQVYDPVATPDGTELVGGTTYAVELASFPGTSGGATTCSISQGPIRNSYRGGTGYFRDPVNGTAWLKLPDGSRRAQQDLPFVTYVR